MANLNEDTLIDPKSGKEAEKETVRVLTTEQLALIYATEDSDGTESVKKIHAKDFALEIIVDNKKYNVASEDFVSFSQAFSQSLFEEIKRLSAKVTNLERALSQTKSKLVSLENKRNGKL